LSTVPAAITQSTPANAPTAGSSLADILVSVGHITADQLRHAQRIHKKIGRDRTLLSVMQELSFVTAAQVRETLQQHKLAVPLGELLVELGFLKPSELQTGLALQKDRPNLRIGEVLVDNRLLREDQLYEALSFQLGMELANIDPTASAEIASARSVLPGLLRSHSMVPVMKRGARTVVAFADPQDTRALEAAKRAFGADLIVCIGRKSVIEETITRLEAGRARATTQVTENAIVAAVNQMVVDAASRRASDIHIEPARDKLRIRFRVDGVLTNYKDLPLEMAPPFTSRLKVMANADITERRRHQDGRILFEHKEVKLDLRFSCYVTLHGETIVMRLLNNRAVMLDIDDLGMSPTVSRRFREDALDSPSGVIVVTGPTGSGKTTTLYGAIGYLNNPTTSIITAEDPVEYVVDGISQCSINPKAQVTFEETLKHIVRQDPDVIVIGEIRDRMSAEVAIQAALTGHKVLTTFHTEDTIGGLVRLLNMKIDAFLVSSTVVSIVAQRLLRRVCAHCSEPHPLTPQQARRLGYEPRALGGVQFRRGVGCAQCGFSGYRGRTAVFELLVLNEQVKSALLEHKPSFEIRRISTESTGLVTLLEDGVMRAARGETSFDELIRGLPRLDKPRPPDQLRRLLGET
jgi:type IV pilus assembly protein PilB